MLFYTHTRCKTSMNDVSLTFSDSCPSLSFSLYPCLVRSRCALSFSSLRRLAHVMCVYIHTWSPFLVDLAWPASTAVPSTRFAFRSPISSSTAASVFSLFYKSVRLLLLLAVHKTHIKPRRQTIQNPPRLRLCLHRRRHRRRGRRHRLRRRTDLFPNRRRGRHRAAPALPILLPPRLILVLAPLASPGPAPAPIPLAPLPLPPLPPRRVVARRRAAPGPRHRVVAVAVVVVVVPARPVVVVVAAARALVPPPLLLLRRRRRGSRLVGLGVRLFCVV